MAKGRKLTTSRSERILGSTAYAHTHAFNDTDSSELGEADVWSTADNAGDITLNASQGDWESRAAAESNGVSSVRQSWRRIPPRQVGGLTLAFEDSGGNSSNNNGTTSSMVVHQRLGRDSVASPLGHQVATSAPVNVPDWSKILRVASVESLHDVDDASDDEKESEMIPPHEYLAREYARSRNSVFEGVGRTLKGRDMRRVRDAVWSQTGFDG